MLPGMRPHLTDDQAIGLARSVAAEFGVRCTEPVMLRAAANVLVHLAPAPIVARLPGVTGEVRTDVAATFAKDVAFAGYLAAQGAPVVAPSAELPPGPHERDGRVVRFWTYVEHDRDHAFAPADVARLLAELHAVSRAYPGDLPDVPPLDIADTTAHLRRAFAEGLPAFADDADLAALAVEGDRIVAELRAEPSVPLHGDAHSGNLLHTPNGPLWTDFEDAWRGPVGWDLACLRLRYAEATDGEFATVAEPGALCLAARRLQMVNWQLAYAVRYPRYRANAVRDLRAWRER
jgi:hypothetical protein